MAEAVFLSISMLRNVARLGGRALPRLPVFWFHPVDMALRMEVEDVLTLAGISPRCVIPGGGPIGDVARSDVIERGLLAVGRQAARLESLFVVFGVLQPGETPGDPFHMAMLGLEPEDPPAMKWKTATAIYPVSMRGVMVADIGEEVLKRTVPQDVVEGYVIIVRRGWEEARRREAGRVG